MLKARVMVVEDERVVALAIAKCLQKMGHTVPATVSTGEEAVRRAEELDPDLILMDIRLAGEVDGVEAASRIARTRQIPVIYLTAYSDDKTLERARVTEPFGYILKPFEEKSLRSAIEMALYKSSSQRSVRRAAGRLSSILGSLGEGVIVCDTKGTITFLNPAAERLTGFPAPEALNRVFGQILRVVREGGKPAMLPVTQIIMQGKTLDLPGYRLLARDGSELPVDVHMAPLRGETGNISGMVLTFHEPPRQD